jgi:hypothetical protein
MKLFIYLLLSFLTALNLTAHAQKGFYIKKLSVGYRISEIDAIGTNPFDISPLLKEPSSYNQFLNQFIYNGYGGSPGPQTVHTFHINAEIYKNRRYGFWKHIYLQTGLFITNQLPTTAGGLEHIYLQDSTNITYSKTTYSLKHNTQYFGINLGINRTTKLAKWLNSTIGLQVQGGIALIHNYKQFLDSSLLRVSATHWETVYSQQLPTMQGKHYFQWQVMLPLGIEYEVWKQKLTIRAEVAPAYVHCRYRDKSFAAGEAHAAGLWFIYKL